MKHLGSVKPVPDIAFSCALGRALSAGQVGLAQVGAVQFSVAQDGAASEVPARRLAQKSDHWAKN